MAFFFLEGFSAKQQKTPKKKKSLQRYRALSDNYMENKMFVSKNDRSKWLASWEFDRSSPRSGWTLSVDWPLFSARGSLTSFICLTPSDLVVKGLPMWDLRCETCFCQIFWQFGTEFLRLANLTFRFMVTWSIPSFASAICSAYKWI